MPRRSVNGTDNSWPVACLRSSFCSGLSSNFHATPSSVSSGMPMIASLSRTPACRALDAQRHGFTRLHQGQRLVKITRRGQRAKPVAFHEPDNRFLECEFATCGASILDLTDKDRAVFILDGNPGELTVTSQDLF